MIYKPWRWKKNLQNHRHKNRNFQQTTGTKIVTYSSDSGQQWRTKQANGKTVSRPPVPPLLLLVDFLSQSFRKISPDFNFRPTDFRLQLISIVSVISDEFPTVSSTFFQLFDWGLLASHLILKCITCFCKYFCSVRILLKLILRLIYV